MGKRLTALISLILIGCGDATADNGETIATPMPVYEPAPETVKEAVTAVSDRISPEEQSYSEFAALIARHRAMSERVNRISRRLRVANAPLCSQIRADAGLTTHRLDDYPPSLRRLAQHFLELDRTGRFIRTIVPNSPADKAGLRPGIRIVSGWPIEFDQPVIIETNGRPSRISLAADTACIAPAFVVNFARPNASTDGREIELSTTLVEQVGDDGALALIIAHEMSHALRGHSIDDLRWDIELQADSDALILMRNAGYDIAATVSTWEAGVEVHRESQSQSRTHPPVHIRLDNLQQTLDRIHSSSANFIPLPQE